MIESSSARADRTRSELLAALPATSLSSVDYIYVLPLLLDTRSLTSSIRFRLGARGATVLQRLHLPPLIPVVERAARRRHPYEETFRSMLSLCADMLTHEQLFTLTFFAGDATVWVSVLQPTWQFIVDYVSEVILTQSSGAVRRRLNEFPHAAVNINAKNDCYGLLLCIRLCYEYRARLRRERWLSDVGALFDSLLALLWPAFKITFGSQLASFGSLAPRPLWPCIAQLKKLEEQVRFIHPVVKNYTEFCASVLSVALGAVMATRGDGAREEKDTPPPAINAAGRQGRSSLSSFSSSSSFSSQSSPSLPASNVEQAAPPPPPPLFASSLHGDWSQLRERALRAIAQEEAVSSDVVDGVDGESQLAVLQSNLTFMQVQLLNFLQDMADYIMEHTPHDDLRQRLYPLRMCFVLNNLHHLKQGLYHHPILEADLAERRGLDGKAAVYHDYEDVVVPTLHDRADFSTLDNAYTRHRGEFVHALIRLFLPGLHYVVCRSDVNGGDNHGVDDRAAHADEVGSAANDQGRHATAPPPPSSSPDDAAMERSRDSDGESGAILRAADSFLANWRAGLNGIRDTVAHLITDPAHAREVTAQACMECLLYNTRFHAAIGVSLSRYASVFAGRTLRSLVVTNQNIMQHMRTMGTVDHLGTPYA